LREEHTRHEFTARDTKSTLATMAPILKQIGLLSDPSLPVFGAETARKVPDQHR